MNCCPSPFFLVQLSPPSSVCKRVTVYSIQIQCVRGRGDGVLGLRQINTCRKVPLHFALPSMAYLSTARPHLFHIWTIRAVNRISAQPHAKMSFLHVFFNMTAVNTITVSLSVEQGLLASSVTDSGCLSRILDPNFSSRIQGQKDSGSRIRIDNAAPKNLSIFN